MGTVKCYLASKEIKTDSILKEGKQITVRGICTGYLMDVILVKAVVMD